MRHSGRMQNGLDFRFTGAEQFVSRRLGRAVGLVHELFGEPARVGMRVEFAKADLVHGAQRVEHGVEHDFRHAHADEVLHDGRVQRGCLEVFKQHLFGRLHPLARIVGVRA